MKYIIVSNGRWRRWIFESSDRHRAKRFANRWGFDTKEVSEIPRSVGYTVWVGKGDEADVSTPRVITQKEYDVRLLGI